VKKMKTLLLVNRMTRMKMTKAIIKMNKPTKMDNSRLFLNLLSQNLRNKHNLSQNLPKKPNLSQRLKKKPKSLRLLLRKLQRNQLRKLQRSLLQKLLKKLVNQKRVRMLNPKLRVLEILVIEIKIKTRNNKKYQIVGYLNESYYLLIDCSLLLINIICN
jgi:hypothetical protein